MGALRDAEFLLKRTMRIDRTVAWLLFVLGAIYALVSLVNHANFRTYALDLGFYTNASWKYAHGIVADRSMITPGNDPILADHFDLHLMLWSPLIYVFGDRTLLIVQLIAILLGGLGLYRYALARTGDRSMARLTLCCGLVFFGVFSALAFDFHSNVVAGCALPWYLLAVREGKGARSWWLLLFMIAAKENIGLWMSIVSLVLAWTSQERRLNRSAMLLRSAAAFAWSVVTITVIMPALSSTGRFDHNDYQTLLHGSGASGTLGVALNALRILFTDPSGSNMPGTMVKMEFWILLAISGGWALFFSWRHALVALPLLLQKMLNDDPAKWGISGHYAFEFAMVLPIALLGVALRFRSTARQRLCMATALVLNIACTLYSLDRPLQSADHGRARFYQACHYGSPFNKVAIERALHHVPENVVVSASSALVPHLVQREHVYQYPLIKDADVIVLLQKGGCYPLGTERELAERITSLRNDAEWQVAFDDPDVVVFERSTAGES